MDRRADDELPEYDPSALFEEGDAALAQLERAGHDDGAEGEPTGLQTSDAGVHEGRTRGSEDAIKIKREGTANQRGDQDAGRSDWVRSYGWNDVCSQERGTLLTTLQSAHETSETRFGIPA